MPEFHKAFYALPDFIVCREHIYLILHVSYRMSCWIKKCFYHRLPFLCTGSCEGEFIAFWKYQDLGSGRLNLFSRLIFGSRHGTQERVFRLEFISNQDFTDSEFMKWRETCAVQGVPMPTHDELDQKLKDIKEAMIYEFKEEDIEKVGSNISV